MSETEDPLEPLLREAMQREITEAGGRVKVTINLSNEALRVVRELAQWRGITMTEVFRQAITTEKFFFDALTKGDTILLKGPGRRAKLREVVIR